MKKTIILFMIIFLLCGCTNLKCIKSHEQRDMCVAYTYVTTGKVIMMIPHYYDCTKTVCDEYEEVSDE